MKKSLLITIFFLSVFYGFSQNKEIDSLKNIIKTVDSLELKAAAHGRIAWLKLTSNVDVARAHLDSSQAILLKLNYANGIAKNNYKYGVLFRLTGEYDKALQYIGKSYQYNLSQKDSFKLANDLFQRGVIYSLKGDYDKSIKEYYNILSIYERLDNKKGIGMTLNSIGIVYKNLENYPKAITIYKKAINTLENTKYKNDLANTYGNLGAAYMHKKDYNNALVYYQKAREIDLKLEYDWGLSINSHNIGLLYVEMGNYTTAIKYLNEAYGIQIKNNYKTALSETRLTLGKAYLKQENYNKSEIVLLDGLYNSPKSKKILRDYQFNLHQLYKQRGQYKKSLDYYEVYLKYHDSILKKENLEYINELDIKYETEKKDKELVQQKLQLQKKKSQYNYMTGVAIFSILAAILIWFLFQQRQKRKNQEIVSLKREHQIKTLESLIEGEEKERFRIAKELHDGVNGDLSAIKFKLSSLLDMNNQVIKEAVAMIDKSYEQVRAISHNLIPPSLEDFDLIETLDNFCHKIDDNQDINVTFQHVGETFILPKKDEINIFRIVQELVSNSIKHAEATEINVQLSSQDNSLQITVDDNGKGFDKETVKGDGIGLENIQSRIEYLEATVDFSSNDRGTSYIIEIDLDKTV